MVGIFFLPSCWANTVTVGHVRRRVVFQGISEIRSFFFLDLYMLCLVTHYFRTPIRAPLLVLLSSYSHITRTNSTAVDEPKNVHYSVDPSGKTVMDLSFASEPLGLPASDGYGWPQFQAGESIGPEKCYLLSRKLGWGMSSSTWLSRDQKYVSSHCP